MKRRASALPLLLPGVLSAALSGPPIASNDYRIDLSRGPVAGSADKTARGGADVAWAHDAGGLASNPAAVAVRPRHARGTWDWDGALGSFLVGGRDYDLNGNRSAVYRRHRVVMAGGLVRRRTWGAGVYGVSQQYDVELNGAVRRFALSDTRLIVGRSWAGGRWAWGAGVRIAEVKATPKGSARRLLHLSGGGFSAGVQGNPRGGPWRVGLAHHGAVNDDPDRSLPSGGAATVDGLIVPRGVDLPSATILGASWSGGGWTASADVQATGRVREAYGVESFLEQRVQRSGRRATFAPRAGLEREHIPGLLRLRAGAYHEPSRFQGVAGRWHGTAGFEARLFRLRLFGERHVALAYALDAAPRYAAHFFSLGFWH